MGTLKAKVGGNWVPIMEDASTTFITQDDADDRFVNVTGDTLTGSLTLAADPAQPLEAATKQYVDAYSGGGATLIDFPTPLSTWVIDIGKVCDIIIIDSAGTRVEPGNMLYEGTKVTLTFSAQFSGRAYCFI